MADLEDGRDEDTFEERAFIARGRDGLTPVLADAVRVRHALSATLAGLAVRGPSTAAPATTRRLPPWASKLALVAVTGTIAGAVGFGAGYRTGAARAPRVYVSPGRAEPSAGVPVVLAALESPTVPGESPPATATAAPTHRPQAARAPRDPKTSPVVAPRASLDEELRALRAVERAQREGHPRLALALLAELDRTIPHGALVEERAAAAVVARCALHDVPFDVAPAEEFAARHPGSVYLERVRQACASESQTDSDGQGNSKRSGGLR